MSGEHPPRLNNIWRGKAFDGHQSIRLDWSNDRHHEVVILGNGNVDNVVNALIGLAHLIGRDPHLRTAMRQRVEEAE